MMLSVGIVGKPNAGKSTLFNALTNLNVPAENYPFCTIDKNTGVVAVPDEKFNFFSQTLKSEKLVPATVSFVDIAGLVKGASKGEGLGNLFLSHIREVDLIMYLLNAYSEDTNPIEELETVETELIIKDIESLEKRKNQLMKDIKNVEARKNIDKIIPHISKLLEILNSGKPALSYIKEISDPMVNTFIKESFLLTAKKYIIVFNINENISSEKISEIKTELNKMRIKYGFDEKETTILEVNAKLEYELSRLTDIEKAEYIKELNIEYIGLPKIIQTCYKLLDFITFYTGNEKIANAWQIKKGTTAKEAAGVIHTDLMNKFIRADILHWKDFTKILSWKIAKDNGSIHSVGKEYPMEDGDIMLVYHS